MLIVWMQRCQRGSISDRQRPFILPLLPIDPFFVGFAFLFHFAVSLGESVLILSDGKPPIVWGRLSAIGYFHLRQKPSLSMQEADDAAGFSAFCDSANRPIALGFSRSLTLRVGDFRTFLPGSESQATNECSQLGRTDILRTRSFGALSDGESHSLTFAEFFNPTTVEVRHVEKNVAAVSRADESKSFVRHFLDCTFSHCSRFLKTDVRGAARTTMFEPSRHHVGTV